MPITCCRKPISPQGSIKFYLIFKNGKFDSVQQIKRQVNSALPPSACSVDPSDFFFLLIPLLLSLFLLFCVILCFPNDYNNEALSSASTTDAPNPLSLNLSLSLSSSLLNLHFLCLTHCFDSFSLIRRAILQQTGNSLLPISIFFNLSTLTFTSFWKSISLSVLYAVEKIGWCLWQKHLKHRLSS